MAFDTAVITGDIIGSAESGNPEQWLRPLRSTLSDYGREPESWQIYRGDSFQVAVPVAEALRLAFRLSAVARAAGHDVRLSLGLGDISFKGAAVTESQGTAFTHSGRAFEDLEGSKRKFTLRSGREDFDREWELILYLLETLCDGWTRVSAQTMALHLARPDALQSDLAAELGVSQPSVSSRLRVAHATAIHRAFDHYLHTLDKLP